MRWVICLVIGLAFAPSAFAGDFDALRGSEVVAPPTFTNWSGFYAGGQVGFGEAAGDFSRATQPPIAYLLRETDLEDTFSPSDWPLLGKGHASGVNYGGFVGYNTQWQDLAFGIEANFNHVGSSIVASDSPISRITPTDSGGNTYLVNLSGTGTASDLDYVALRARAGWVLGNFLPYGFLGLALGRADVVTTANVSGQETNASPAVLPCTPTPGSCINFSYSASTVRNGAFLYGFTVGGGLDALLTDSIFLRGELEYTQFAPVSGVLISIASARVGGGVKF
jgi:outer membrane immunogenic protein